MKLLQNGYLISIADSCYYLERDIRTEFMHKSYCAHSKQMYLNS